MYREGIWEIGDDQITGYFDKGPSTFLSGNISRFRERYVTDEQGGQTIGVYMDSPDFSEPYLMFSYQSDGQSGLRKALKEFAVKTRVPYKELRRGAQNDTGKKTVFRTIVFWILFSIFIFEALVLIIAGPSTIQICAGLVLAVILMALRKTLIRRPRMTFISYLAAFVIVAAVSSSVTGIGESPVGADFTKYPDYSQESTASAKSMDSFIEKALTGDVESSLNDILPEKREQYEELFGTDPQKLALIAEALKQRKLVYISDPGTVTADDPRMAEYEIKYDGNVFYVRMYKINGIWLIDII